MILEDWWVRLIMDVNWHATIHLFEDILLGVYGMILLAHMIRLR